MKWNIHIFGLFDYLKKSPFYKSLKEANFEKSHSLRNWKTIVSFLTPRTFRRLRVKDLASDLDQALFCATTITNNNSNSSSNNNNSNKKVFLS